MSKNISIDEVAYEILKSHKNEGESFSEVIKREMALALDGQELVDALRKIYKTDDKSDESAS